MYGLSRRKREDSMPAFRIQPHVRLQQWVAEEEGFFREEGLDYEFEAAGFAGASSVQPGGAVPLSIRSGAFEDMDQGRTLRRVRSLPLGDQRRRGPPTMAGCGQGLLRVRLGNLRRASVGVPAPAGPREREGRVGYHSGSHYSAIQALEPFLAREEIELDV